MLNNSRIFVLSEMAIVVKLKLKDVEMSNEIKEMQKAIVVKMTLEKIAGEMAKIDFEFGDMFSDNDTKEIYKFVGIQFKYTVTKSTGLQLLFKNSKGWRHIFSFSDFNKNLTKV